MTRVGFEETAMNNKTRGTRRGRRRAGALAVMAAVAVLATACSTTGSSSSSASSASTGSATYRAELAYAQCMRAHGLTKFPIPSPGQSFSINGHPQGNSPAAQANDACEHLLSSGSATATATATTGAPGALTVNCLTGVPVACYTPAQIRVAYGIKPLLDRGIDGRGVTVVLPEEAETGPARPQPIANILAAVTDIRQDLANFDARFGLPPARIRVITTTLAGPSASPWLASVEEVVDTEMVHAVAPDATIVELPVAPADVSTPARFAATWAAAVRIAARNGQVISQSGIGQDFNLGEDSFTSAEAATMNSALEYAAARHVTVVVASGDYGAIGNGATTPVRQVSLPASEPLVLAAGGTTLTANPVTGAYISETAWNNPGGEPSGSGGGFSHLFARPSYQDGVPGIGATRGVPDVAADADSGTCMAFAMLAPGGSYELVPAGGTSVAAPTWGGLIALADQEAGHPLGFVNPAIYRIARGPLYHKAFHDITTGNNTVTLNGVTVTGYQAGPGWDPVTGWGTPDAQVLIPLLAG
jgi:subtilase family serine protease